MFTPTEPGSPGRPPAAPLVHATRRHVLHPERPHVVESVHAGHVVAVGPDGATRAILGDPDRLTFPRSAVKPFQATACLEALLDNGVTLPSPDQIAVSWASHRGEPAQLATVARLLARSGRDATQLSCPPARPEAAPDTVARRLNHNCSGKHALFALAGDALGCAPGRFLDPTGKLQRRVLGVLETVLGPALAVGVDGCGAPAVAVPLAALASGFRALVADERWARVREAGRAYPELVGGRRRLESALLGDAGTERGRGFVAKPGAEGVFGVGWMSAEGPWGVAVKVDGGAGDACATAVHGLLAGAGLVAADSWNPPPVRGGGRPVGLLRPSPEVQAAAEQLRG